MSSNNQENNNDDDKESSDDTVQLGFCIPIESLEQYEETGYRLSNWSNWDGGQIGGCPTWLDLDPDHILPPLKSHSLVFICQLYAPFDNIPNAFHRSIYVFYDTECNDIKVYRQQLPIENQYWPLRGDEENISIKSNTSSKYCIVCGFTATGTCPLQKLPFCCKEHQKLYKKYGKPKINSWKDECISTLPNVFNTMELVVEEEPSPVKGVDDDKDNTTTLFDNDDNDDSDADLEQEDLNEMITGKRSKNNTNNTNDPVYDTFVERYTIRHKNVKDQVLRYCRNGKPLWMRSNHQPENIPNCEQCGSKRTYEFQLMPQMLHYLKNNYCNNKNNNGNNNDNYESIKNALQQADSIVEQAPPEQIPPTLIEQKQAIVNKMKKQLLHNQDNQPNWGIVVVYTCSASCGTGGQEYAWIQSSIEDEE